MTASISYVQTALSELFLQEFEDPQKAIRASVAWNKLLMVQLDILLAGYLIEVPSEPEVPNSD